MRASKLIRWTLYLWFAMELASATKAWSHCDTMDGTVIKDATVALDQKELVPVLKWVKPHYEEEVKKAFELALSVRSEGKQARELADQYFFETLVRVHRAGEGAPYTGLKPAGQDPGPAIQAADTALTTVRSKF